MYEDHILKKSHLYTSIAGFNILVVCATFLIWYYATDISIGVGTTPSYPHPNYETYTDTELTKYLWLKDFILKYGGLGSSCAPFRVGPCDFTIPPMHTYEINSIVDTLHLQKITGNLFEPTHYYHAWFDYDGRYYEIALHYVENYLNYLFYDVAICLMGTFAIILIWKKLQNRQSTIRDSTHS